MSDSPIKKCLFPAAGYGTRFLPATKSMPKEMLPVVNKPLIQYGVEEALDAGMSGMAIVTGRGKRAIEDHFDINYELEDQIADRREFLNESVNIYNIRIEQFPDVIIASLFNFAKRTLWQIDPEHRQDVKVAFNHT